MDCKIKPLGERYSALSRIEENGTHPPDLPGGVRNARSPAR